MAKKFPRLESYLLNLAGEYRVCGELCKRGTFATISYGHRKSADVYVISESPRSVLRVEVKTSQGSRFVTRITQKGLAEVGADAPDFWVLVSLRQTGAGSFDERFFVLSHAELCDAQRQVNERYAVGFRARHGEEPDFSMGVDNVGITDIAAHENAWQKISTGLVKLAACPP